MDDRSPRPAPPGETLATLRASQDRALEREGIPMLLALVDMTDDGPLAPDDPGEGVDLSERLCRVWDELAGGQRDGDLGAVQSILGTVAFAEANAGGNA